MMIFVFGSGLAGIAGAVLAPIKSVSTTMGFPYAVDCFMVLVLGGVGSLWGVLAGGAVIGEAETVLSFIFNNVIGQLLGVPVHRHHHPHRAARDIWLLRATLTADARLKWMRPVKTGKIAKPAQCPPSTASAAIAALGVDRRRRSWWR